MIHIPDYIANSRAFHNRMYEQYRTGAQRLYPSEDVVRFAKKFLKENKPLAILDAGAAFGANTLTLAKMSPHWTIVAIDFCEMPISHIRAQAQANVRAEIDFLPFIETVGEGTIDVVMDHMCSYGLMLIDLKTYISRLRAVVKPGGLVLLKTLSDACDIIKDFPPETLVDARTLKRVCRPTAPFPNDDYLFRFTNPQELTELFNAEGFRGVQMEKISRTYRSMQEYYEQIIAVFERID